MFFLIFSFLFFFFGEGLGGVEENKGPTRSQSPQMISAVACELVPRCASHEQVLSLLRDS